MVLCDFIAKITAINGAPASPDGTGREGFARPPEPIATDSKRNPTSIPADSPSLNA
jgi:hypothetical protein